MKSSHIIAGILAAVLMGVFAWWMYMKSSPGYPRTFKRGLPAQVIDKPKSPEAPKAAPSKAPPTAPAAAPATGGAAPAKADPAAAPAAGGEAPAKAAPAATPAEPAKAAPAAAPAEPAKPADPK